MQKLKLNQLNILKLNNKIYLPYQLHQLPKWFNKDYTDFISLKGYTYINLDEHYNNNPYFDYNNFKSKLTYNRDLTYVQKR
tara:strand:+ start:335 stop:577 length:243 start_codon:yes stop_codon:yes gene_type:complete